MYEEKKTLDLDISCSLAVYQWRHLNGIILVILQTNEKSAGLQKYDFYICFCLLNYTWFKLVLEQECTRCFQVEKPLEKGHFLLWNINLSSWCHLFTLTSLGWSLFAYLFLYFIYFKLYFLWSLEEQFWGWKMHNTAHSPFMMKLFLL